jgi:Flp pilus assembly pilin Flp
MAILAETRKFATGEEGASLVEYCLLVALLAAASIAILYGIGTELRFIFSSSDEAVRSANEVITTAS